MKKTIWKKGLAVMLGMILGIQVPFGALLPSRQTYAYTERSAKVNASTLNVRSGPGTGNSLVTKLAKGTAVTVINETTGSDGKLWYQIRFSSGTGTATGYVLGSYIRFPVTYTPSADFEQEMNNQGFPESYKTELRQLHAQYPNWVFEAQQTGLDWNTVIENESVLGRNLVGTESISSYKSLADGAYNWDNGTWTGFDGSAWVAASEEILKYYMDPRNFLDDVFIFQFMSQEYDPNIQTKAGLETMIQGTFLEGSVKTGNISGSSGSSSSETASSGSSSVGPGGDGSSSSGQSSNVIVSPSGGRGGNSSGSGSPGSTSPGSTQPQAELVSPQASISKRETALVTSSADSVVIGVMPGSDSSQGAPSTSVTPGTDSGTTVQPGTNQAPSTSPTPSAGTSSGTITAGTGMSNGPSASATPGGTQTPGGTDVTVDTSTAYADIIMKAAEQTGVNPYILAAMILQEQGSDGRGKSITGTNATYPGYYNYFNVGAYASGSMGAIERGLWYASQNDIYGRPWDTPEKSILGGAEFYAVNYVNAGQDTLYLKKYNVQGSNMYKHQYMTNVDGAASEASYFAEGYAQSLKSTELHFKIPVYQNMPDTPCARPTVDGSPNNKLSGLGVEGFALTPTFSRDTTSYDLIVDPSVSSISVYANTIDSKASVSGTGSIQIQDGINDITIKVTAQNGSERDYVIHVVRQTNGPTYNAGLGGNSQTGTTVTPDTSGSSSYGPGVTDGSGGPGVSSSSGTITAGSGNSSGNGGSSGSQTNVIGSGETPGGSNVIVIDP